MTNKKSIASASMKNNASFQSFKISKFYTKGSSNDDESKKSKGGLEDRSQVTNLSELERRSYVSNV